MSEGYIFFWKIVYTYSYSYIAIVHAVQLPKYNPLLSSHPFLSNTAQPEREMYLYSKIVETHKPPKAHKKSFKNE